jgi:hypothetical protein
MKTIKHTTTIITALFLGFITLNAQTTTRNETRDNRERATVKRTEARQGQSKQTKTRQITQTRQSTVKPQRQQTTHTRQSTVRPQRQQTVHANQNRNTTARYRETATVTRTNKVHSRPVSISTRNNPNSDYRAPKHRTHAKNNKYSEKRYYGGKHYHHV